MMSAKRSVKVGDFWMNRDEVRRNGPFSVASNRLRGSGRDPTEEEIQALANQIEKRFSDSRPTMASVSLF